MSPANSPTPSRSGISIGDFLGQTFAALGALLALHARARTGHGQVVDSSAIYEAVLAMTESLVTEYQVAGYTRERTGAILPNVALQRALIADGQLVLVAANQDTVFRRLAAVMAWPELADDPCYASHSARGEHQVELDGLDRRLDGHPGRRPALRRWRRPACPRGGSTGPPTCSPTPTTRPARRSSAWPT